MDRWGRREEESALSVFSRERERESTPGGVQPAERGKGRIDAKGRVGTRQSDETKRSIGIYTYVYIYMYVRVMHMDAIDAGLDAMRMSDI